MSSPDLGKPSGGALSPEGQSRPYGSYFERMSGGGALPSKLAPGAIVRASLGALLGIGVVAWMASWTGLPLILGSFGASCVLLFGFPEAPFSQPRNVIGGHFIASLTGLVFLHAFGPAWWSMAIAAACAIALMHVFRTVHPPAGSNPIIVMLSSPGWSFLITPTLLGSLALVSIAVLFNNIDPRVRYPKYWC